MLRFAMHLIKRRRGQFGLRWRYSFPVEIDGCCGVGIIKCPSHHLATVGARFDGDTGEVSSENVVAGIASIMVYICPGLSELFA